MRLSKNSGWYSDHTKQAELLLILNSIPDRKGQSTHWAAKFGCAAAYYFIS